MAEKVSLISVLGLVMLMAVIAYILSFISEPRKFLVIFGVYAVVVLFIIFTRLTIADIGFSQASLIKGIKLALPFMAIIIIGGLITYLINPDLFKDERYNQNSTEVLLTLFLTLPLVTVLLEELVFRGVIFGLLNIHLPLIYAAILSSLSFGFWHFFTAGSVELPFTIPKFFLIVLIIIATTIAGLFFTWLRIKSDSLLTPILVHWTINATGVVLAYFAWKT